MMAALTQLWATVDRHTVGVLLDIFSMGFDGLVTTGMMM